MDFPLESETPYFYTSHKIIRHVITGAAFENYTIFYMEIVVGCSVLLSLYQKIKCKIRCALTNPYKIIVKFILHSIYLQVCIRQVHRPSSMTYTSFSGSFGPNRCVVYVSDWYAKSHFPNPPLNNSRNTYLAVRMTLNSMIRPFCHQRSNPCQSWTSHVVQFRLCAGKRIFLGSISKDVKFLSKN